MTTTTAQLAITDTDPMLTAERREIIGSKPCPTFATASPADR